MKFSYIKFKIKMQDTSKSDINYEGLHEYSVVTGFFVEPSWDNTIFDTLLYPLLYRYF